MNAEGYAPEHAAPPAYRPLSGGAVTALVLAIVPGLGAMFGLWWLEAVPLAIVLLSWPAISAGRRRGRGLAITAGIIAAVAGGLGFLIAHEGRKAFEAQFDGLVTALDKGDRAEIDRWVADGVDKDAVAKEWTAALAAAKAIAGPYAGRTIVESGWLGPVGAVFGVPDGVVDVVDPSRPVPILGTALWFQVAFQKETLWGACVIAKDAQSLGEAKDALAKKQQADATHVPCQAVRFFRKKAP